MTENVPSAFPHLNPNYDGNWDNEPQRAGMTLRDWFAGQALAGYFANRSTPHMNSADRDTATYCFEMADAMLAARQA